MSVMSVIIFHLRLSVTAPLIRGLKRGKVYNLHFKILTISDRPAHQGIETMVYHICIVS